MARVRKAKHRRVFVETARGEELREAFVQPQRRGGHDGLDQQVHVFVNGDRVAGAPFWIGPHAQVIRSTPEVIRPAGWIVSSLAQYKGSREDNPRAPTRNNDHLPGVYTRGGPEPAKHHTEPLEATGDTFGLGVAAVGDDGEVRAPCRRPPIDRRWFRVCDGGRHHGGSDPTGGHLGHSSRPSRDRARPRAQTRSSHNRACPAYVGRKFSSGCVAMTAGSGPLRKPIPSPARRLASRRGWARARDVRS